MNKQASVEDSALRKLAGKEATTSTLIAELTKDGIKEDDVVKGLIALQHNKKVAITEPKPYTSLAAFAWSPLSTWFWAAVASVVFSLALVSVTSGVVLYLRYVFGSALVLFLPGYSLIEALYPKRELDELTRFALSIGLSLALVPLIGLVLNYTPFGIRLLPVTLSIAFLTLVLLVFALSRKHAYYRLAKGI